MLDEHLSQAHDAASRRFEIINAHVAWIHQGVLQGKPTRILDLGCGPGLYTERLARYGHPCVGIDFSPASIRYAKEKAQESGLDCQYFEQDIRSADYGAGFGLVMSIFGEFNVFRPKDAKSILEKAYHALLPNGYLLMEPHTFEKVILLGQQPASWFSADRGLFSDQPHLFLQENFWVADEQVAIQRYFVIDAATGDVQSHSSSTQAYTDDEYRSLLAASGFGEVTIFPALGKTTEIQSGDLLGILARKIGP
jgi:SAM-dependent methyltransferase